ncbi:hypothetical protein [Acaryochloris marina]|uniref:Uncharacterized protein n=1 Tax=Acaryochloris marina (strain MBIC 11017) TaxID=329726 RepID=A8ZQV0_ACAM1|nr:hypothetical protein [Acaryochloris marina]ABW33386.1 hypothetical protein AM1_H0036 [Acaryochloris marina MBIC11017]
MQQLFAGQKELQQSQMQLISNIADLKDVVLANAEQISSLGQTVSDLRSITSDLVGYSINQEGDIQTVREDLQALKRRVDAIDGSSSV